jgi:hypothetical protein
MQPSTDVSFVRLLYRYLFFGWLFRDAQRGTWLEREAALRHNWERAVWLPTYMRRWSFLGITLYATGAALEWSGLGGAAPVAYVPACVAAPVLAVAAAGWLALRGPGSTYLSSWHRPSAPRNNSRGQVR